MPANKRRKLLRTDVFCDKNLSVLGHERQTDRQADRQAKDRRRQRDRDRKEERYNRICQNLQQIWISQAKRTTRTKTKKGGRGLRRKKKISAMCMRGVTPPLCLPSLVAPNECFSGQRYFVTNIT